MNLNDMMVFAEVVEQGGFTAAGEVLGRPKSNVSRAVSRLEASLEVQLLERTTRSQTLTEIGRIYYEHCLRIREELVSATNSIETLSETPRGRLRVSASVSVGQYLIARHLANFIETFPEVKVDLRMSNRRVDLIDEGFDVVIRVGESPDSNLVSRLLCSQELPLYAAPDYLASASQTIDEPQDLLAHRCLFMNAASERPVWKLQRNDDIEELEFMPAFACDDFSVLRRIAQNGGGIAQLPDYVAEEAVRAGQLVRILPAWSGDTVQFHSLVPSRRGVTPKIRVFLDYLVRVCN
jgi:DNA-binding transcriptional LysR family regulator